MRQFLTIAFVLALTTTVHASEDPVGDTAADIGEDLTGLLNGAGEMQMTGVVQEIEDNQITLQVGEEEYTIQGEPGQFADLQQGDEVQLTVVPEVEGDEVHRTDVPDTEYLTGDVDEVRENVIVIQDADGISREVRVDENQLEGIGPGQRVIIELEDSLDEVDQYRAIDVNPLN